MATLTIMVGLPASGKSTIAKTLEEFGSITIVSTDSIRKELLGAEENQSNPQLIFDTAYARIEETLKSGKNCALDATNLKAKNRKWLCKKFRPYADRIVAYYLATDAETCIARDKARERTVGEEVIRRMAATASKPSLDEGFDDICCC
jgi:predicted kinase